MDRRGSEPAPDGSFSSRKRAILVLVRDLEGFHADLRDVALDASTRFPGTVESHIPSNTLVVPAAGRAMTEPRCRRAATHTAATVKADGTGMGLRRLFQRNTETALPGPASEGTSGPGATEPLTPEQLAEIQQAWGRLALAAEKPGGVSHFRACTRNGKSWQENPASVRAVAALLRDHQSDEPTPGIQ